MRATVEEGANSDKKISTSQRWVKGLRGWDVPFQHWVPTHPPRPSLPPQLALTPGRSAHSPPSCHLPVECSICAAVCVWDSLIGGHQVGLLRTLIDCYRLWSGWVKAHYFLSSTSPWPGCLDLQVIENTNWIVLIITPKNVLKKKVNHVHSVYVAILSTSLSKCHISIYFAPNLAAFRVHIIPSKWLNRWTVVTGLGSDYGICLRFGIWIWVFSFFLSFFLITT